MNGVQIAIIGAVVLVIAAAVAYPFYQETRFKSQINKGFNKAIDDALEQDTTFVMEAKPEKANSIFAKDIVDENIVKNSHKDLLDFPLMQDESPIINTSQETDSQFVNLDSAEFRFKLSSYDHIIDVVFANSVKVKILPELSPLCGGKLNIYILEKNIWQSYVKGKKYIADGIRIVIHLVGENTIVSPLQLANVYNEVNTFALKHSGVSRQTDSESKVVELQKNFKKLKQASLELELFIVNHDYLSYDKLKQVFTEFNLVEQGGVFYRINDGEVLFYITDENLAKFEPNKTYRLFSLNAKLHHFKDPISIVDVLFDFAEEYQTKHNSRLLSSNKVIMREQDYKALIRQINLHFHNLERNQIESGSELVKAVCP